MSDTTPTDHCTHIGGCNPTHLKIMDVRKTFGSKKVKRNTETTELLTIHDTSFASDIVLDNNHDDDAVAGSLLPSSVVPKMNADATTTKDMYDVHSIVSHTVLETLLLDKFVDSNGQLKKSVVPYDESTFVTDKFRKAYEKNDQHCCKILVYALYLMALFVKIQNLKAARDHRMHRAIKYATSLMITNLKERYTDNPAMQVPCTFTCHSHQS
ncbi:hypothetical protein O0I10_011017 [Lichtheimia ornata]|uniref:Uncharacterized protein n=1 Tax=Lichtheimia ornata TaxID=688661 RepID=A0AAD7UWE6_9FUNG|nr:uncharacterized protein O0I10_011017 [Lichtheimia ornata]KAJ8653366.1 hypothetical protein O0I10_011017 [Lichtheimia ornata]